MARWAAGLLVLLAFGVAGAAERPPASLVPAQVLVYHELNLAQWHLGQKGTRSLEEVFEQTGLLPGQRAVGGNLLFPGPVDNLKDTLEVMWDALQFVGPRIGLTMQPGPGGAFLAVAQVKDAAALSEAAHGILRDNQIQYKEEIRRDGVKVLSISDGPTVAIAPDWAALFSPPELLDAVSELAASGGEGSLAADARYQRAIKGLPGDALVTGYVGPMFIGLVSELITSPSRPGAGIPLPAGPEDGIAWTFRASAEPQEGRRMLSVTFTIDANTASTVTAAGLYGLMSPVFDRAARSARKSICLANVQQLSMAVDRYVARTGKYPEADRWIAELQEYVADPRMFHCPEDQSGAECSYGMNLALSGKPKSAVRSAGRQVLIYETAHPGSCPRGGKADVASPPRHLGGTHFGFPDGSAKWVPEHATQDPAVVW